MILVTLGTQKQEFTRLLEYIENSGINDEIIVQAGYTKFESTKMKMFDFITYDEMQRLIKKASLIITHGGTGSIITGLKSNKKIIACARLNKYGEHVDDHQTQIVDIFYDEKYILKIDEIENLKDVYIYSKKFKPKKFKSNTDKFVENIKKLIG